jgi:hypothetical protein
MLTSLVDPNGRPQHTCESTGYPASLTPPKKMIAIPGIHDRNRLESVIGFPGIHDRNQSESVIAIPWIT